MTISLFITLLTIFATVTGLTTEAVKKILDSNRVAYSANIVASIIAAIVGIGGTAAYYAIVHIPFTAANVVCMILMGLAVAVGSMIGYDKVTQAIQQISKK